MSNPNSPGMHASTQKLLLVTAVAAFASSLSLLVSLFMPGPDGLDSAGYYFGRDFVNYWSGGHVALWGDVRSLYDLEAYQGVLKALIHPEQEWMIFSYLPNSLPLLAIFGALPYPVALLLWTAAGLFAFFAAAFGGLPKNSNSMVAAAILVSPILWVNFAFGQMGLLLAGLFVGALRLLPTQPIVAGIMIGLLTIKPQLGLFLPFILIIRRDWTAFAAATATALGLAGLTLLLFGFEPWKLYFENIAPLQSRITTELSGFYRNQTATPLAAAIFLGLPVTAAWIIQILTSVLVFATGLYVLAARADWPLKVLVVSLATLLALPYLLAYDLAIPLAALIWLLSQRDRPLSTVGLCAVTALWTLPFTISLLIQAQGVPVLVFAIAAVFVLAVREALGCENYRLTADRGSGLQAASAKSGASPTSAAGPS